MRHCWMIGIATIVAMGIVLPGAASAQEAARTFGELNSRVRSGETVDVTDTSGRTIRGVLRAITTDAIVIERSSVSVSFAGDQVERVRVRRRDSLWNGILGGLAAGAAGGALLGLTAQESDPSPQCTFFCDGFFSTGQLVVMGMALGAAAGMGVGAAVDALRRERRLVYERVNAERRVTITPVAGARAAGIAVVVRM